MDKEVAALKEFCYVVWEVSKLEGTVRHCLSHLFCMFSEQHSAGELSHHSMPVNIDGLLQHLFSENRCKRSAGGSKVDW